MDHIEFLREKGSKGGKSGVGQSKIRGDSEYYRKLRKKRRGDSRAGNSHQRKVARRAKQKEKE